MLTTATVPHKPIKKPKSGTPRRPAYQGRRTTRRSKRSRR
jgi:hypothetical protein